MTYISLDFGPLFIISLQTHALVLLFDCILRFGATLEITVLLLGLLSADCQADGLMLIKASLFTNKHRKILFNFSKETLSRNVIVYPDATLNVFFHKNDFFHYRMTIANVIVRTFF